MKKLQDLGAKIGEKQKLHADMAIENAKASMLSQQHDGNAQAEAD